ncbi:hypothetical protein ACFX2C_028605 [Malus domestica]
MGLAAGFVLPTTVFSGRWVVFSTAVKSGRCDSPAVNLGFVDHRPSNGWGWGMVVRERWVGYGRIRGEKSGVEEEGGRLDVRGIEEGWVGAEERREGWVGAGEKGRDDGFWPCGSPEIFFFNF